MILDIEFCLFTDDILLYILNISYLKEDNIRLETIFRKHLVDHLIKILIGNIQRLPKSVYTF